MAGDAPEHAIPHQERPRAGGERGRRDTRTALVIMAVHSEMLAMLRTLQREKRYAAINIAGLALGIACSLILGLYLRSELTYDRHFAQHERIYRVVNEFTTGGVTDRTALTSWLLAPALAAENPQIQAYTRFFSASGGGNGVAIRHGAVTYHWQQAYFADGNVFQVFSHQVLAGDPGTALKDRAAIAVSETFARRYFGSARALGQTLTLDNGIPLRITLVFADLPPNTHLKYDVLFSAQVLLSQVPQDAATRVDAFWGINVFTYLLMAPGFNPHSWARINDTFYSRHMAENGRQTSSRWRSWLQPLTTIHLDPPVADDLPAGNRAYLYGCTAAALFILLVACINYMNLATARAAARTRSVAIRRVLGASRLALGMHFLGEALLLSMTALVLGTATVEVLLTIAPVDVLFGYPLRLDLAHDPGLLGCLIALGILVGLISGAYPAIYLSGCAQFTAAAGRQPAGSASPRLREILVGAQFTISAAVIACTLLMWAQMRYLAATPLGFDKEHRLVVTLRGGATIEKVPAIRAALTGDAHILGIAEAGAVMGQPVAINYMAIEGNDGRPSSQAVAHMAIGEDFVKVMGLKLLRGQDLPQGQGSQDTPFLVNQALVRKMGWVEPLGKRLAVLRRNGHVAGVVGDFHFRSLHLPIEPFVMYPLNEALDGDSGQDNAASRAFEQRLLILDISATDLRHTLAHVEQVMTRIDPQHPFERAFLDESLEQLYQSEHALLTLIGIFAALCVFIACLGLNGLAAFMAEQRKREIATRKVLGASHWQIVGLLSRRIAPLVTGAAALGSVAAYFTMEAWLRGFAYRAPMNPVMFLAAAALCAAVAFLTVALKAWRIAGSDPGNSLREV